jgi:hypothetical protein
MLNATKSVPIKFKLNPIIEKIITPSVQHMLNSILSYHTRPAPILFRDPLHLRRGRSRIGSPGRGYNMALINCPSCGKSISPAATSCPECGHPLRKQKRPLFSRPAGCAVQLVGAFVVVLGLNALIQKPPRIADAIVALAIGLAILLLGRKTR